MADSARRLFVEALPAAGGRVDLPIESARHARVLRLQPGNEVTLFDARGGEARARLTSLLRSDASCQAEPPRSAARSAASLTLLVGLPKGEKLDLIVRMATELGVDALWPVACERSVSRGDLEPARYERLTRIAREACGQSGQLWTPELAPLRSLEDAACQAPAECDRLVFWEHAASPLAGGQSAGSSVWAVIGPEGGLSAREVDALTSLGYRSVGLGPGLLRVETAAVVVSALLLDRLGRLRHA